LKSLLIVVKGVYAAKGLPEELPTDTVNDKPLQLPAGT
jgi:hypothetical protein